MCYRRDGYFEGGRPEIWVCLSHFTVYCPNHPAVTRGVFCLSSSHQLLQSQKWSTLQWTCYLARWVPEHSAFYLTTTWTSRLWDGSSAALNLCSMSGIKGAVLTEIGSGAEPAVMHTEDTSSHSFITANTQSRLEMKSVICLVFILCGSRPQQYRCYQVLPVSIHVLTFHFKMSVLEAKRKKSVSQRVIERTCY